MKTEVEKLQEWAKVEISKGLQSIHITRRSNGKTVDPEILAKEINEMLNAPKLEDPEIF